MPLLCEVYAVIGQGDVPLSGVSEADAQLLCQGLTELGKGVGIINELLTWGPTRPASPAAGAISRILLRFRDMPERNCSMSLNGLFRTFALEQVVGSQHDDQ